MVLAPDLSQTSTKEMFAGWVAERGIVAPKGPAGSILLFDANVAHGSGPNMSPIDRKLLLATYNSVLNIPRDGAKERPDFLCARDYTPVQPLEPALV